MSLEYKLEYKLLYCIKWPDSVQVNSWLSKPGLSVMRGSVKGGRYPLSQACILSDFSTGGSKNAEAGSYGCAALLLLAIPLSKKI